MDTGCRRLAQDQPLLHWRERSGRQRPLGLHSWLRLGVVALSDGRLGPLSVWTLGLGTLLWLDVGLLRAMGLGTLSLWPLVCSRRFLVLVARSGACPLSSVM